jgi:diguanylate cyclase (GGDEF)-like protein
VLREAAHRIAGCVRKADTLARHGGDEFVVVIPDLHQDGDSQVVAEKILRALEPPFRVDGRDFTIGASIGISLFPTDAGDGEACCATPTSPCTAPSSSAATTTASTAQVGVVR